MSQILATSDIVNLLENRLELKVWNICGVVEKSIIEINESTEFQEIMIMVYNKQDVKLIKTILEDVVNVTEVVFTGFPQALDFGQI